MTVDEYVLIEMSVDGVHSEIISHGYDNLEDASFALENYYDKEADIRLIALMG